MFTIHPKLTNPTNKINNFVHKRNKLLKNTLSVDSLNTYMVTSNDSKCFPCLNFKILKNDIGHRSNQYNLTNNTEQITFKGQSINNTSELPPDKAERIYNKINELYGSKKANKILEELTTIIKKHKPDLSVTDNKVQGFNEKDILLITYADQIKKQGEKPLKTLHKFLKERVGNLFSSIHILPFYPYSSDDGFSVIDYNKVNTDFGNWQDVKNIANDYKIMFDCVFNHISSKSEWFEEYLKGNPKYKNFFIEGDPNNDYSKVIRPRSIPLLTKFDSSEGLKYIWTTFSDDQIDLNYKNEKLMLKVVDQLLNYVDNNANLIRLDAIGYLWKEQGTSCINLPQTHKMIQLFRDVLDIVKPDTKIVTETNVPHNDNISYFGDGHNEAHMIYAFSLPPLTLNTFHTGDARHILHWVSTLKEYSNETTFFNFLASHDGIGVQPAKGILSELEIKDLCDNVRQCGGHISYKDNGDGTKSPYELNINYLEALSHPDDLQELKLKRFIAANGILLSLRGIPGIYIHSLLGSKNYHKGVEETGKFRSINREKLNKSQLDRELNNPECLRNQVFMNLSGLIKKRRDEKAFSPNASQQVLYINNHVFSILRTDPDCGSNIVCLINVSNERQKLSLSLKDCLIKPESLLSDLVSGKKYKSGNENLNIVIEPYQIMWLKTSN